MSTLTDRYVEATSRALPESQRAEVEAELRATIADMTEAREAAGATPKDAERGALVELGEPTRLAAGYTGRPLYLLGPGVYPEWLRLVKVLLALVVPIVAVVRVTVGLFTDELENGPGPLIADTLQVAALSAGNILFWTVLAFAVVERTSTGARPLGEWDPDTLPEGSSAARFGRGELVGSLVFLGIAVVALVWQQTEAPVGRGDGAGVPLLDPDLWSSWIPVLLALFAAMAGQVVLLSRAGRWTMPLAALNAVLEVCVAVLLIWLAQTERLFNPDAVAVFAENGWAEVLRDLTMTVSIAVGIITVISISDGFGKARNRPGGR